MVLFQPMGTSLRDYGRLLKDGQLKVKSHEDNRLKQRYSSPLNLKSYIDNSSSCYINVLKLAVNILFDFDIFFCILDTFSCLTK